MKSYPVRFCTACGAPLSLRELFGRQRPFCPDCGWIYFADPKVAAAVLIERGDTVLLVRRLNDPRQGLWSVPAGFIDADEDPAEAARRECLEETGLEVEITGLLGIMAGREHPGGADMVISYRARITGGTLQAGDDAGEAAFFSREALPELAFQATRKILGLE